MVAKKAIIAEALIDELIVGENVSMGPNAIISWNQVTGTEQIPLRSDLTWGNLADIPTDLLTQPQLTAALTDYVTNGTMTAALANTLNTGNFSTIITKDYIASMNLIVGDEILMGSNARISWLNVDDQPFIPSTATDVGARPYDWLPAYGDISGLKPPTNADNTLGVIGANRLTYIDENGIYTGTLTAQQINAIQGITLGANTTIQWASLPSLPSASQVGALPNNTFIPSTAASIMPSRRAEARSGHIRYISFMIFPQAPCMFLKSAARGVQAYPVLLSQLPPSRACFCSP
jgi:hypothetical protein